MIDGVTSRQSEALAQTEWLAEHLADPSVRVVDTHFNIRVPAEGTLAAVAERDTYGEAHIPGAVFVDVLSDLADLDDRSSSCCPTGSKPSWSARDRR